MSIDRFSDWEVNKKSHLKMQFIAHLFHIIIILGVEGGRQPDTTLTECLYHGILLLYPTTLN